MSEDILERAKKALIDDDMTYEDYNECISLLIAEVKRLRSHHIQIMGKIRAWILNDCAEVCRGFDWRDEEISRQREEIDAKDARIKELEEANRNIDKRRDEMAAFIERLEAAFLEAKRCPTCNGAGKLIDVVISRNLGRVESERVCPLCEGKWEEKAREALEEIKTGGAMSNSVDICPFDDDLTCPLDYHTCEIYRERMEEEQ